MKQKLHCCIELLKQPARSKEECLVAEVPSDVTLQRQVDELLRLITERQDARFDCQSEVSFSCTPHRAKEPTTSFPPTEVTNPESTPVLHLTLGEKSLVESV